MFRHLCSILSYTLTSTTYLTIGRTESALLVLLQNLRVNKAGSPLPPPTFLAEQSFAVIDEIIVRHRLKYTAKLVQRQRQVKTNNFCELKI